MQHTTDDDSKSPEFDPQLSANSEFEPFALSSEFGGQHTSLFEDTEEPVLNIDEQAPVYRGVMDPPALSYGAHNGHPTAFDNQQSFSSSGFANYNDDLDNQGFGSIASHGALDGFQGFASGFNDFDKLDLSSYHNQHDSVADVALRHFDEVTVTQAGFPQVPCISTVIGERALENSRFVVRQPLSEAIDHVKDYLQNQSIDFQWDPSQFLARCESFGARCVSFHIRVMKDTNEEHIVEFQRRSGCVIAFNQVVSQCRAVCCNGAASDMSQWDDCGMLDSDVDMKSLGALAPPSFASWGQSSHDEPSMESSDDDVDQCQAPPRQPLEFKHLESSTIMSLLSLLIAKGIDLQSDAAEKLALLTNCPRSACDLWNYQSGHVLRCVETLCGLHAQTGFGELRSSELDVQRGRLVRNALAMLANIAQSIDSACQDIANSPLLAILGELIDQTDSQMHFDLRRQSGRLLSLLSASNGASLSSLLPLLERNAKNTQDDSLKRTLSACLANVQRSGCA